MADYYTVQTSFIGTLSKGVEVTYIAGEVVPASDPAFQKWPQHFVPLVVRGVEQATAAPGEKRTLSIRRGKAKPAKAKPVVAEPEPEPEPAGHAISLSSFRPQPHP